METRYRPLKMLKSNSALLETPSPISPFLDSISFKLFVSWKGQFAPFVIWTIVTSWFVEIWSFYQRIRNQRPRFGLYHFSSDDECIINYGLIFSWFVFSSLPAIDFSMHLSFFLSDAWFTKVMNSTWLNWLIIFRYCIVKALHVWDYRWIFIVNWFHHVHSSFASSFLGSSSFLVHYRAGLNYH